MQVAPSLITEFWFEKEATINWYTKPESISVQHVHGYGILDKTLDAFLCTLQWCLLCELVSNEAFKNHDSGDDFVSMLRLVSLS